MYKELASYSDAANSGQIDHAGIVHLEHEVADLMAEGGATVLARWILARESELVPRAELEAALDQLDESVPREELDQAECSRDEMESERDDLQSEGEHFRDAVNDFLCDCAGSLLEMLTERLETLAVDIQGLDSDDEDGVSLLDSLTDGIINDLSTEFHALAGAAGIE